MSANGCLRTKDVARSAAGQPCSARSCVPIQYVVQVHGTVFGKILAGVAQTYLATGTRLR
ncbi:MAG: hypothetical protein ACLUEV_08715 [Alistipes sp.]